MSNRLKTLGMAAALWAASTAMSHAQTEVVLAHVFPANSQEQETAQFFADKVDELSKGELKVSLFPASQLGGWSQISNQLQSGAVNVTFISTTALGGFTPIATVDSWPYLFTEREQFERAYNSEDGRAFFDAIEEESGYRVLAPVYKGFRYVYLRDEADSVEGKKIRVPGLPLVLTAFESWGASPTPMDVAEIYTAMQQGVVDGIEIEAQTADSLGVDEVAKTVLLTRHMMPNYAFIFWGDWLDSLPEDQRKAIEEAASAASAHFGEEIGASEEAALENFKKAGANLTEVDTEKMRKQSEDALSKKFPDLVPWVERLRAAGQGSN